MLHLWCHLSVCWEFDMETIVIVFCKLSLLHRFWFKFPRCLQLCTDSDFSCSCLQVSLTQYWINYFFLNFKCCCFCNSCTTVCLWYNCDDEFWGTWIAWIQTQQWHELTFSTGKVDSVTFEQSSSQVVKEGTEELRIDCSHDDSNLQVMLWYQHKQSSQSMSLIGYKVLQSEGTYEDQFKDSRFQIKGENAMKGSLIIRTVSLSDSAVYFCAASTQWCGLIQLLH